jgi:short-subunit dehydrogenase
VAAPDDGERRGEHVKRILIAGATSAIAYETAKLFAAEGAGLILLGRNESRLAAVSADLFVRGAASVATVVFDATRPLAIEEAWRNTIETCGEFEAVLIAHGALPDQKHVERDVAATLQALEVNFTSVAAMLTLAADYFERKRRGCITVISSVAGDRGRQSNYVYGSAKGGLNVFVDGLRNRLKAAGVRVITVKPGFVATPMTAHLPRTILFTSPEYVARAIYRAMTGRGQGVFYVPWFWRLIMVVVRNIPGPIFDRMRL